MTARTRTLIAGALLAAGLVATGCAASGGAETPTDASTRTPSAPSPTPTRTPPPVASPTAAAAFPDCETLFPLEVIRAQPGWASFEFITKAIDAHEAPNLPGPLAVSTAEAATARQDCVWGVPNSDSGLGIDMFRIDESAATTLVDELTAAPDEYRAFTIDGSPAFLTEAPWGIGEGVVVYVFDGTAWLVMGGHEYDESVATAVLTPALETLRSANP